MTDGMYFLLYALAKDTISIPTTMFFCLTPLRWLVGRLVLAREWCLRCICPRVLFIGSMIGQCSNAVVVRRCVKLTNTTASQEGPSNGENPNKNTIYLALLAIHRLQGFTTWSM